ncbi:MAG: hypothetical protein QOJ64_3453 [Acidobacteriota bacterium]|jgi:hypothetical protein|nr:hypothetical protein [Acidobacteriota bacterium]
MNYFNYFTEIEDAFVRRRGKHLLLSPMDWALIESWKEMGVPLHVALNGIEHAFDSFESKPRRRSVHSLLYCQEEVEAQYAEWRDGQLGGGGDADNGGSRPETAETDSTLPFPRAEILNHLERAEDALRVIPLVSYTSSEDDFLQAVARAATRLIEVKKNFSDAVRPDAEKLEQSLTSLDNMLDDALRTAAPPELLARTTAAAEEQLEPYRKRMEPAVFEKTLDNLVLKRLRDAQGVPRLSLFYL